MIATQILATVDGKRLQKGIEGLLSGAYSIPLTTQSEAEIRGCVANGDGKEYGVTLTAERAFCSCKDSMFRHTVCKHAVCLALHVIRNPKVEERTPDLTLAKVRSGWEASA